MSAKAKKATEDALLVAGKLTAAGYHREAEIIRRVCRSNETYRSTLAQLWQDNMALRGGAKTEPPSLPSEEGDEALPTSEVGEFAKREQPVDTPYVREKRKAAGDSDAGMIEEPRSWCAQCERSVTAAQVDACSSQWCKAKAVAA